MGDKSAEFNSIWDRVKEKKTPKAVEIASYNVEEQVKCFLDASLKKVSLPKGSSEWKHAPFDVFVYLCVEAICSDKRAKDFVTSACKVHNVTANAKEKIRRKAASHNKSTNSAKEKKNASKAADGTYDDYIGRTLWLSNMLSHQVLALRRAKETEALTVTVAATDDTVAFVMRKLAQLFKLDTAATTVPAASGNRSSSQSKTHLFRRDVMGMAVREASHKLLKGTVRDLWRNAVVSNNHNSPPLHLVD